MAKKVIRKSIRGKSPPRQTVKQARNLISDDLLLAFIRAARPHGQVLAIELANRHLDNGATLDQLFKTVKGYGFFLSGEKLPNSAYRIRLGCQAGPNQGDSGVWRVEFDDSGTVRNLTCEGTVIC